jgi:hypothetical protein
VSKPENEAWHQQLTPVILYTQKAEIKRIEVGSHLDKRHKGLAKWLKW